MADALTQAGLRTAASLRTLTPQELVAATGLKQEVAEKLVDMVWGRDSTPVVDKGPPKSIQVRHASVGNAWFQTA